MSSWFWTMVQALVVLITLVFINRQVKIQTESQVAQTESHAVQAKSHLIQTVTLIHQRWCEDSMLRARHIVCKRYREGKNEFDGISEYIAEFMEELGNYVNMGAMPVDVMWEAQSWYLEHYYPMFREGIEKNRRIFHDPTLYSHLEELIKKMSKQSIAKGAPNPERGEEDLERFVKSELAFTAAALGLLQKNMKNINSVPSSS